MVDLVARVKVYVLSILGGPPRSGGGAKTLRAYVLGPREGEAFRTRLSGAGRPLCVTRRAATKCGDSGAGRANRARSGYAGTRPYSQYFDADPVRGALTHRHRSDKKKGALGQM